MTIAIGFFAAGGADGALYDALVLAQSPFAYYKLDEAVGASSLVDSSGNARHLTSVVGPPLLAQPPLLAPGSSVRFNSTGTFNYARSAAYHTAISALIAGNKAFTLEALVKLDTISVGDIMHLGDNGVGGSQGVVMRCNASGSLRIQAFTGSFAAPAVSANGAMVANVPYLVHARRKLGGLYDVFINGTNVGTGTNATAVQCADTSSVSITLGATWSSGSASNLMKGYQDRPAIYGTALSDAEILAHAKAAGLA